MTCTLSPSQPLHSVRGVNFKTHQTQSESHFLLGNSAICFARLLLVSETALTLNEPARAQHQCQISEEMDKHIRDNKRDSDLFKHL